MQDITWVSRVWEDTLNKSVANTTVISCISCTDQEAVPAAWVLVLTKFRSIACDLERLLWWEDAYATSFLGPVSHRYVYSQDILAPCCSASLPCQGPMCLAPPTAGLVWEAAYISRPASSPGLQLEIGGNLRPILFLAVTDFPSGVTDCSTLSWCHCQIRKLNSSPLMMFPWVQKEIQSLHR